MPAALVVKERRRPHPINRFKKYGLLLRGFTSEAHLLYDLTRKNYKQFLSDYQQMKTGELNGEGAYYLNDKVAFVDMLQDVVQTPKTLALILKGELIPRSSNIDSVASLLDYVQAAKTQKVIIKPIFGAEGKGVALVQWDEGQLKVNDELIDELAFEIYLSELNGYFVSEFIQQGSFAQNLFPDSLNTIRMLTMIDPYTEEAFIAGAVQRVGTNESAPADNFRRGGLSVEIDDETGTLGWGAALPEDGIIHWHDHHPDTDIPLTHEVIPNWRQVKAGMLVVANFAYQTHQIKYVGWDIVILEDGFCILEGNSWPGVNALQVHKPLLLNPQVRAFYKYYDAI